MSTQQLITIGGLFIFTFASLSFNDSTFIQQESSYFNEAALIASGLGKSLIEEIHCKAFDEETVNKSVHKFFELTPFNKLTFETGEGINNYHGYYKKHGYDASTSFDDIDDYNGFQRNYTNKFFDDFNVSVKVHYVLPSNPSIFSIIQTFAKKVEVTVSNPYLTIEENDSSGTLKFSSIITY
jgi:hypothetical protein